ncbi:uncharacterized protein N7482_001110 [Penicillium canariense]|uniref:Rrn9 domain-containing protein n=1 Tax=Penicillium canariense TaxID=189055 RepID=A0A9W9LSL8_9EURO|nr:uncharacterized protein N7482_001110 [Penicillium canariense]KAJ5175233.1 hypothetical protein N7482_001110 [Penicillium canariense]
MSSFSGNQQPSSSQFYQPQSAQPFHSIFGDPSSDVDLPPSSLPEPLRRSTRSLFGNPSSLDVVPEQANGSEAIGLGDAGDEEDDLDVIMRERPLDDYYGSDGDSFKESDEDEDEPEGQPDPDLGAQRKNEPPRLSSSPMETRLAPISTTYVLDRGRDLRPGVERPNRWIGPPSTYRRITADDRGAYEAIVTNRARDLAAHLYNAFAIRNQRNQARDTSHGPQELDGQDRIFPPKRWVAWPRPPSRVPRPDEIVHRQLGAPGTLRMPHDLRPSADLEESIIADMMRHAKQTFMAREWDLEEVKVHRARREDCPEDMKDEEMKNIEDQKDEAPRPHAVPLKPVVQADDGASRQQLRPLSRNVITQVDRLLMGLHHSMKSRVQDEDSGSDSDGDLYDTDDPRSRSRHKSGSRSRSRGRKRARRSSRHSQTPSHRSHSARSSTAASAQNGSVRSTSRSRGRSLTSRGTDELSTVKYKLGLRDWSEVMGLAAMMGLPTAAVMRASKRCADLFGQDMTFQTFHEGRVQKVSRPEETSRSVWQWEYLESETDPEVPLDPEPTRSPSGPGLSQRKRKSKSRLGSRSQSGPRRHRSTPSAAPPSAPTIAVVVPSTTGGLVSENRTDPEREHQAFQASQAPRGKGEHRKADIICPIKRCSRHTNGFSRTWNLNLHMKRVHPGYTPADSDRSRSQSTPGGVEMIEID